MFVSTCFVHDLTLGLNKMSARAVKCIFLRYSQVQKGYRCYCPSTHRFYVSADITFFEDTMFFVSSVNSYLIPYYQFFFLMFIKFQNMCLPHRLIIGMVLFIGVIIELHRLSFHPIPVTQLLHQSILLLRSHPTLPLTNILHFIKVNDPLSIHILFITL